VRNDPFRFETNGVGEIGGKFYISGGLDYGSGHKLSTAALYVYDPADNSVVRRAPLPKSSWAGVTGVIHGELYVLPGACDGENWPSPSSCETEPIRDLFRYDPARDTWEVLPPAPHYHRDGVAGVIGNKFYVAGGWGTTDLDVYDPKTNAWTSLASMPVALAFATPVGAVLDGKLYVVVAPNTYAYDPRTDAWEAKADYPGAAPAAMASLTLRGRHYLLAFGGSSGFSDEWPNGIPNESQLYEP
jgi:N-acetylneuraminic acid mutarotase